MGRPSAEHVEQLLLSKIRHLVADGLELDSIALDRKFEAFARNLDVGDKLAYRIFGLLVKNTVRDADCSSISARASHTSLLATQRQHQMQVQMQAQISGAAAAARHRGDTPSRRIDPRLRDWDPTMTPLPNSERIPPRRSVLRSAHDPAYRAHARHVGPRAEATMLRRQIQAAEEDILSQRQRLNSSLNTFARSSSRSRFEWDAEGFGVQLRDTGSQPVLDAADNILAEARASFERAQNQIAELNRQLDSMATRVAGDGPDVPAPEPESEVMARLNAGLSEAYTASQHHIAAHSNDPTLSDAMADNWRSVDEILSDSGPVADQSGNNNQDLASTPWNFIPSSNVIASSLMEPLAPPSPFPLPVTTSSAAPTISGAALNRSASITRSGYRDPGNQPSPVSTSRRRTWFQNAPFTVQRRSEIRSSQEAVAPSAIEGLPATTAVSEAAPTVATEGSTRPDSPSSNDSEAATVLVDILNPRPIGPYLATSGGLNGPLTAFELQSAAQRQRQRGRRAEEDEREIERELAELDRSGTGDGELDRPARDQSPTPPRSHWPTMSLRHLEIAARRPLVARDRPSSSDRRTLRRRPTSMDLSALISPENNRITAEEFLRESV